MKSQGYDQKMAEILLSPNHNIDTRPIPYFKQFVEDMNGEKMKALEKNCRVQWHRFYYRVLKIMCRKFDRWNPGALRIDEGLLRSEFSYIKDPRTYDDLLDLMRSSKLFYIWKVEKDITLYSPQLEKSTKELVKRYLKWWKDSGKINPKKAGKLLKVCKQLVSKNEKT